MEPITYRACIEGAERTFNEAFKAKDADRLRAVLALPEVRVARCWPGVPGVLLCGQCWRLLRYVGTFVFRVAS